MKKIYSILIAISISFTSYAQAWIWDEIEQDAEETDPITFLHIFYFATLCMLIWLGIKSYEHLKSISLYKFLKIRKAIIILSIVITFLIPISICTYFDLKNRYLEEDATHRLNNIINNAYSYIEIYDAEYAEFDEILPQDNQLPNNEILDNNYYTFCKKYNIDLDPVPYNGIFRCYNINTVGCQVIFAGDAKRAGFSSEENPALYHGWIEPYRIRYYSPYNINPYQDLNYVYDDFIQSFIWEHRSQLRDNMTDEFFHPSLSLNEYYEINHIDFGGEMWAKNKLYYEGNIQECTYEYKTIRYGNFDITYCISNPRKLGVCEKYSCFDVFGKSIYDEIHIVKRNEALVKYCSMLIILLCGVFTILYFGNPTRKQL